MAKLNEEFLCDEELAYELTHNMTEEFVELSQHPRTYSCPQCDGDPDDYLTIGVCPNCKADCYVGDYLGKKVTDCSQCGLYRIE
jgi:hypothetical protein